MRSRRFPSKSRRFPALVVIAVLVTAPLLALRAEPAAAASCYFGAQKASATSTVYSDFGGARGYDVVYYRIGYTCGGTAIEVKVERIYQSVSVVEYSDLYQHCMRDQEVRWPVWQSQSHNHTTGPCWYRTGTYSENAYPNKVVPYAPNDTAAYFFCSGCSYNGLHFSYCHFFLKGGATLEGGYC